MAFHSLLTYGVFLQEAATPFATPAVVGAIIGFIVGSLLTAILFLVARRPNETMLPTGNPSINPGRGKRVNIKHCSQCDSTYTDEEMGYCLRDGTLLNVVGTMPASIDPEETRVINRHG